MSDDYTTTINPETGAREWVTFEEAYKRAEARLVEVEAALEREDAFVRDGRLYYKTRCRNSAPIENPEHLGVMDHYGHSGG